VNTSPELNELDAASEIPGLKAPNVTVLCACDPLGYVLVVLV
jgi:hypothetical protein